MLKIVNINLQKKIFNTFNFFMLLLKPNYSTYTRQRPRQNNATLNQRVPISSQII